MFPSNVTLVVDGHGGKGYVCINDEPKVLKTS